MRKLNAVRLSCCSVVLMAVANFYLPCLSAQEASKNTKIDLAGGKLVMTPPADWKSVPPKSSIVQHEFMAPKDEPNADKQVRITIMQASGGVEANIERWYGQFQQPDGSSTKEKSKVEQFQAAGQKVHLVDIPGTFKDSMGGGPFAPPKASVTRENYRMLGAIIDTQNLGQFFLKATGPKESVEKLRDGMRKMLEGMEIKK